MNSTNLLTRAMYEALKQALKYLERHVFFNKPSPEQQKLIDDATTAIRAFEEILKSEIV